ncbi:CHAT domain-containing protein [Hanstruepera marina]|uniref:CHAT domain-containing protein n=1 Tax=Hanstruepera marina TaxID=2873265 RepID=UPI001CA64E93|nr:CHAT domain-containing tetratricopeptide repeat protein [Hanstruepera marina]
MGYLRLFFICLLPVLGFSQQNKFLNNTFIADSLDKVGEYEQSLKYRNLALEEPGHTSHYINYLNAKWHYTNSCILETKGGRKNILEGLEHSKKAYQLVGDMTSKNDNKLFFKHEILNRIYHQYGYTGQWQETLIHAKKDYSVLRDTFPEHRIEILYILDDLGFIYSKLENPEKSNEYYLRSFELYKEYHPENLKDVYLNNNRIINNYRKLGLKNEEFKLLAESENYWDNTYKEDDAFFQRFNFYDKLADWHINYGNKELAESYLFKKEELFDSVADSRKKTEKITLVRRERVNLNENYIKLYLKHKDYDKAKRYIKETNELLKDSTDKYRWDVISKANLFLNESKMPDVDFNTGEDFLKSALNLITKNTEEYNINPIQYQIELFDFYVKHAKKEQALKLLEVILQNEELTNHDKLQLLFKKAFLLQNSLPFDEVETHIKIAFSVLLNSPNSSFDLKTLDIEEFNEFYTFDILNNILEVANLYLQEFNATNDTEYLDTAQNLFALSSRFFERIYKGDAFNENLYNSYKSIEEGLLNCVLSKPSIELFDETLEALENNSSRLTWSKFIYGKNGKMNVPDSLLLKEENLKALVNYYQERIYEEKQLQTASLDTLKLRLTDLTTQLKKHQDYISKKYIQYNNSFTIQDFKNHLKADEVAIKYIVSENDIYVFTITSNSTDLKKITNDDDITLSINDFAKQLSTFNSNVVVPDILKKLVEPIAEMDKQNIVIVHSGLLNILPFEVLLADYFDSSKVLHYTSSLKLYVEEINAKPINSQLNVGIFKAQNGGLLNQNGFLPELDREIESIKDVAIATDYYIKNREDFFKNVKSHNVLHFGIHTTIDENMPELSALNFAESEVLIGSLYSASLQADLAVLSACDTGNGVLQNGEGIQSISKAFTYTGVPSTVMSLWKVDDKATATIMGNFYKHLAEGKPKDLALKLAKKDYLDSDIDVELKHPYYWSGFVISGNMQPFKPQNKFNYWWLALLVLPAIVLYYKKSKLGK